MHTGTNVRIYNMQYLRVDSHILAENMHTCIPGLELHYVCKTERTIRINMHERYVQ